MWVIRRVAVKTHRPNEFTLKREVDHQNAEGDELVEQVLAGSREAFGVLYERHYARLFALAFSMLANAEAAEDAVHDAFVMVFEDIGSLQNPRAFDSWASTILVRACYKKLRRRSLLRRLGLWRSEPVVFDQLISPSAPAPVVARLKRVYALVDGLDPQTRLIVLLRRVEGMTYPDVAEHVGVSESTVKRRLREVDALMDAHRGG